jgi:hypothetical protein
MITRIKRTAQFLFDNAELIAEYLNQSDNFRTVEVDLRNFKSKTSEFEIELTLYDGISGLHNLVNHTIIKEKFVQLCNTINEDSGVTELPKPVKVRDEL